MGIKSTNKLLWLFLTQTIFKQEFNHIGKRSIIYSPLQFNDISSVFLEEDVLIAGQAWLMGNDEIEVTLKIQKGSCIGHFAHIIALHSVTIEKSVLIADKVFISDCTHEYENMDTPVIKQDVRLLSPVVIGEGSWLGENVCVCGASIGKHCVIGANSVVISDIPDYSVAVGTPAKVVKKYDHERKKWVKVEP